MELIKGRSVAGKEKSGAGNVRSAVSGFLGRLGGYYDVGGQQSCRNYCRTGDRRSGWFSDHGACACA